MKSVIRWAAVMSSVIALSGCMSQRAITTIKETPGATTTLAGMKFRVAMAEDGAAKPVPGDHLQQGLVKAYPELFTNDLEAIPLVVRQKSEVDQQIVGAIITGFTLGIIPFPAHTGFRMEVGVTPWTSSGALQPESVVKYIRRDHGWMTIFTPLGFLPIPGRSDIPRHTGMADGGGMATFTKNAAALSESSLHKAVVSALANMDQTALRQYWKQRQALPSITVDIDGRPFTGRLLPAFSQNLRQPGGADEYRLVLRNTTQQGDAQRTTTAEIPVARRDAGGDWTVKRHYLPFASRPMVATALLENGVPARPVVMPVDNPPVNDFIDPPVGSGPVRWSNGILLHIKNSSLAAELRALPITELQLLTTRLESAMLDLNERTGRANDRAQAAMEKGENPEPLREMATVYRQRGEIMKAIVGQVRQETALRNSEGMLP
ncbi:MAG: hypothetical protein ACLGHE_09570 [Gammaproteobacteria bacterium]